MAGQGGKKYGIERQKKSAKNELIKFAFSAYWKIRIKTFETSNVQ